MYKLTRLYTHLDVGFYRFGNYFTYFKGSLCITWLDYTLFWILILYIFGSYFKGFLCISWLDYTFIWSLVMYRFTIFNTILGINVWYAKLNMGYSMINIFYVQALNKNRSFDRPYSLWKAFLWLVAGSHEFFMLLCHAFIMTINNTLYKAYCTVSLA